MEQKTELKDRIAQARKAAGLSQEQLGEKLGVSRQAISKWESGAANPDVAYLAAMCRELGVPSDWLLLGEEDGEASPSRRCPRCGAGVTQRDSYCPNCGASLTEGGRSDRYTLLLPVPGERPYFTRDAVSNLSWREWARQGAPWTEPIGSGEAADIVDRAPVILCRGLDWAQVGQALELFKDAGVYPDVYRDGDGDTPEELRRARPVPREQFQPPEEKSGMTFGKTVLAVVVGIIAAVLILAFL